MVFKLILFAAIAGGLAYLQYKTNLFWKIVQLYKWYELKPQLQEIKAIHARTVVDRKKINWVEKNITRSTKKKFDSDKQAYVEYIDFCNSKHLRLPANYNELEAIIDTTENALMNPNELLDKELLRASKQYNETFALVSEAGESLLTKRQEAVHVIEDVEKFVNSIARNPKTFTTDIQEITIQKKQFKTTIQYGLEQRKALESSAKGIGTGVAAGTVVAGLAPTAAMWVATTFGTASTGTAISALSGVAATNAALAWLGGGAIAAGGGGMAAGHALLALAGPIGWGVTGTSLAVSVWLAWRKNLKIQESKKDEIARIKNCIEALKEIKGKIEAISIKTSGFTDNLCDLLSSCNYLGEGDYSAFTDEQKRMLGTLVNNTKALSVLLNETITE